MNTKYLYFDKIYLGDTNLGAVYLGSEKIWKVPYYPAKVSRPFMLYSPETRDFTKNGFSAVHPTVAEHDLSLNQAGEISLQVPILPGGEWEMMQPNVIVLAPTKWHGQDKPQAFRIYRLIKSMDSSGKNFLKVYARHVFYDLKYSVIKKVNSSFKLYSIVDYLFRQQLGFLGDPYFYNLASDAWFQRDLEQSPYRNFYTDPGNLQKDVTLENTTIANAIIGDGDSIVNLWGYDFYADNFFFYIGRSSVLQQYGYSFQDSFCIRCGHDMTDVSEDIDYTDAATYIAIYSNSGQGWAVALPEQMYSPFVRPKRVNFTVSFEQHYRGVVPSASDLPSSPKDGDVYKAEDTGHYWEYRERTGAWADIGTTYDENPEYTKIVEYGQAYWDSNHEPKVSYTAKYAPIDQDRSGSFIGQLDGREVGDTGTVENPVLGISTTQRIIRKRVDLIHDITLEIQLGNASTYITKENGWSDTVRSGSPTLAEKQIQNLKNS